LALGYLLIFPFADSSFSDKEVSEFGTISGGNIDVDPGWSSSIWTGNGVYPVIDPRGVIYYAFVNVNGTLRVVSVTQAYFNHVSVGDRVEIIYAKGRFSSSFYIKNIRDAKK